MYMKVSAGDQSSSSSVGACEGVAANPEGSGDWMEVEGLVEMSEAPVLFVKESVVLSASNLTPDVKFEVTCALRRDGSRRRRSQTGPILNSL